MFIQDGEQDCLFNVSMNIRWRSKHASGPLPQMSVCTFGYFRWGLLRQGNGRAWWTSSVSEPPWKMGTYWGHREYEVSQMPLRTKVLPGGDFHWLSKSAALPDSGLSPWANQIKQLIVSETKMVFPSALSTCVNLSYSIYLSSRNKKSLPSACLASSCFFFFAHLNGSVLPVHPELAWFHGCLRWTPELYTRTTWRWKVLNFHVTY